MKQPCPLWVWARPPFKISNHSVWLYFVAIMVKRGMKFLRSSNFQGFTSTGDEEWKCISVVESARWVEDTQRLLPLQRGWEQTWPSSGCPPPSPPPQSSAPPPEAGGRCLPGSPTGPSKRTQTHTRLYSYLCGAFTLISIHLYTLTQTLTRTLISTNLCRTLTSVHGLPLNWSLHLKVIKLVKDGQTPHCEFPL